MRRFIDDRTTRARVSGVLIGIGIVVFSTLSLLSFPIASSAQDEPTSLTVTEPTASPSPQTGLSTDEPTPDPVTNARIQQFAEGGLIERQAALSEGLLLMDRQLRQMQLVEQILAAYGPNAPVEVAPGEFRSFEDTPAGMRQEIAYIDLQIQLAEKRAELQETRGQAGDDRPAMANFGQGIQSDVDTGVMAARTEDPERQASVESDPEELQTAQSRDLLDPGALVVEEIYGQIGNLLAVVSVAGTRVTVRSNDTLPTGHRVLTVARDWMTVELSDGAVREFRIQ